jgi:hypothetical protein
MAKWVGRFGLSIGPGEINDVYLSSYEDWRRKKRHKAVSADKASKSRAEAGGIVGRRAASCDWRLAAVQQPPPSPISSSNYHPPLMLELGDNCSMTQPA